MLTFEYQARDTSGKVVSGQVEASDQKGAATILTNRNLMVISLKPGSGPARKIDGCESL